MPPTGTNRNNCHHPLLPLSWSRREPAAKKGSNTAIRNMLPKISFKSVNAEADNTTNSANHQNSERDARPLNSAYFLKHSRIDSKNVSVSPSLRTFSFETVFIINSLPILETALIKDVT